MAVERDYRDAYPLSEAIADAYTDGRRDGQSWGYSTRTTDDRDYAMARADVLEARVRELEAKLAAVVKAAVKVEAARQRERKAERGPGR